MKGSLFCKKIIIGLGCHGDGPEIAIGHSAGRGRRDVTERPGIMTHSYPSLSFRHVSPSQQSESESGSRVSRARPAIKG